MLNAVAQQTNNLIKNSRFRRDFLLVFFFKLCYHYIYRQGMKRICIFIMAYIVGVGIADAAVRNANSISRTTQNNETHTTSRTTTARTKTNTTVSRATTSRATTKQQKTNVAPARTTTPPTSRGISSPVRTPVVARTTTNKRNSVTRSATQKNNSSESKRTTTNASRASRAAIMSSTQSNTFGTGYNACRDAYFTCMDQFCSKQNDTYRRCVCSSRLGQIQSRENLLSQTANQLQDFKDFNLSVIDKSTAEVKSMITGTAGETIAASSKDTSKSAQQLANISKVLAETKSKSLSTAGTLDIGGDIKQIWNTTDLADGANIANLTGEPLYNAVHAQCSQMVAETCESKSTLNMVVSAYGMYIENDCTTLSNNLDSKTTAAKGTVRDTEREMHLARLENYNAHNSSSINDCIANVRNDITAKNACGTDYVHCLDVTGLYLNRETGEPIYTSKFFQLDGQTSLSGDVLTNQTNRLLVAELNRMRTFAEPSLDKCRDVANDVWNEFVRQAIAEIYQGQQSRIRTVVNKCYDEQSQSLKDFSNIKPQLLLGQRLELSEQMCQEKLDACSNLYGGGNDGLSELLAMMHDLTDTKIAKECRVTLQEFIQNMCAVPSNDTLHGYPYACRVYNPGEQQYAQNSECNQILFSADNNDNVYVDNTPTPDDNNSGGNSGGNSGENSGGNSGSGSETVPPEIDMNAPTCSISGYKNYISCNTGYVLCTVGTTPTFCLQEDSSALSSCNEYKQQTQETSVNTTDTTQTQETNTTQTQTAQENNANTTQTQTTHKCGTYPGSLYQHLVRYALQACVRPTNTNDKNYVLSTNILQDVNAVMDTVRSDMARELARECERLGGLWVDTTWVDKKDNKYNSATLVGDGYHDATGQTLYKLFYTETSANTKWGFCAKKQNTDTTTNTDPSNENSEEDTNGIKKCTTGQSVTINYDIEALDKGCCAEYTITNANTTGGGTCGSQPDANSYPGYECTNMKEGYEACGFSGYIIDTSKYNLTALNKFNLKDFGLRFFNPNGKYKDKNPTLTINEYYLIPVWLQMKDGDVTFSDDYYAPDCVNDQETYKITRVDCQEQ